MTNNYLRTTPVHKRSQKTIQTILNAAEQAFLDVGYDKATTRMIAERSGLPVGSLYHFFPNKKAILDGLAARHFAAQSNMHVEMSTLSPHDDLEAFLRAMIDKIAEHFSAHAPFERIIYGRSASPEITEYVQKFREQTLDNTVQNMAVVFPDLLKSQLRIQAEINIAIIQSLLSVAGKHNVRNQRHIRENLIAALMAIWKPLVQD